MTNQLTYLLFVLIAGVFLSPITAKKKDHGSLLRDIKQRDLSHVIPRGDDDKPVNIQFGLYLNNVADADPSKKEMEIDAWVVLRWNSGITWKEDRYHGLKNSPVPASYMWTPDISVFNGINSLSNSAPDYVMLSHNGDALWVPRVSLRVPCDVDANKLGWNVSCNYRFGFWVSMDELVNITQYGDNVVHRDNYFEGSRFEILGVSAKRDSETYPCCPGGVFSFYDVTISFKEKTPTYAMRGCVQNVLAWR